MCLILWKVFASKIFYCNKSTSTIFVVAFSGVVTYVLRSKALIWTSVGSKHSFSVSHSLFARISNLAYTVFFFSSSVSKPLYTFFFSDKSNDNDTEHWILIEYFKRLRVLKPRRWSKIKKNPSNEDYFHLCECVL